MRWPVGRSGDNTVTSTFVTSPPTCAPTTPEAKYTTVIINPTEAIRRYRMYRETLQRELNLTPSTHLTELVANLAKR